MRSPSVSPQAPFLPCGEASGAGWGTAPPGGQHGSRAVRWVLPSLLVRPRSLRPSWSCGEACAGGSVSRRRPGSRRGLPSWNTQLAFVGESWDLFGVRGPQRAGRSVRGLPAVPRALRVYVGTRGPNLGRACEQGAPPRARATVAEGAHRWAASWPAVPVGSGAKQPWPYGLADRGGTDWGTGQGPVLEPVCSLCICRSVASGSSLTSPSLCLSFRVRN